jgi:hypothetical protein
MEHHASILCTHEPIEGTTEKVKREIILDTNNEIAKIV